MSISTIIFVSDVTFFLPDFSDPVSQPLTSGDGSVLVRVTVAVMKHHDQKHVEEKVYLSAATTSALVLLCHLPSASSVLPQINRISASEFRGGISEQVEQTPIMNGLSLRLGGMKSREPGWKRSVLSQHGLRACSGKSACVDMWVLGVHPQHHRNKRETTIRLRVGTQPLEV